MPGNISPDTRLLFITRIVRLFAYGFLSVVLVLYLAEAGLTEAQIGLLLTLALIGDTLISLWITTQADRIGRRRMLAIGALLMVFAGILFAFTRDFALLLLAATVGVISPSGYEVGPFLSIEQAGLTQLVPDARRTQVFAWYNLAGSFATALGALCGGGLAQLLHGGGLSELNSYRLVVTAYGLLGVALFGLFTRLSPQVEAHLHPPDVLAPPESHKPFLGLGRSRRVVLSLAALFTLDAFAGGFIMQSLVAFWFHQRFGVQPATLGGIFFGANLLAGISALAAAWLAKRVGLINTMVFTHIPSNLLLMLLPFMPILPMAIALLLVRSSISQMDVPTRQSYTMAVVDPGERSAAAGVTGTARTIGAALSPALAAPLLASPLLMGAPFLIAGGLKIIYDLSLYRRFRVLKPPEETVQ